MRNSVVVGLMATMGCAWTGAAFAAGTMPIMPTTGWGPFYAEVYGGATLPGVVSINVSYSSPYTAAIDGSAAFGATFGLMTPVKGLSFNLDVMRAGGGQYVDYKPEAQTTYSVMANTEFAIPVSDMIEIFGGAGAGMIDSVYTNYTGTTTYSGRGAGYQVEVGARAKVAERVSLFGEVKYQNSFAPIGISDGTYTYYDRYPTVNVLGGVDFGF